MDNDTIEELLDSMNRAELLILRDAILEKLHIQSSDEDRPAKECSAE